MLITSGADWAAARHAVAATAPRVTAMLRSARHPDAPALAPWTLTDVAAHMSHAIDAISAMSRGGGSMLEEIWGLSTMTAALVRGESERDLAALADRIDASTAEFLRRMEAAEEDSLHGWLVKGVELRLSNLTCHVLNELLVHGRDIALAEGVPWRIERSHAVLVVCGFLLPSLNGLGRAMVDQEAAAGRHLCYDIRVRGGCRAYAAFDDGDLSIGTTSSKAVDCHLSVDPVAFLLVAWGRISQNPAVARGQLLAWGRRPWLGLKLRGLLRNP